MTPLSTIRFIAATATEPLPTDPIVTEPVIGQNAILDFFAKVVETLRGVLPLDNLANWIQTNVPFLEESHSPIIVIALVAVLIWFIWSWATQTLRKNSGAIIVAVLVIAVAAYTGAVTW